MASDIDIQAREILRTRSNLNQLYVHHTGQPIETIERVMDRDTFLDPSQAVEFGVIDEILSKRPGDRMMDDDDAGDDDDKNDQDQTSEEAEDSK